MFNYKPFFMLCNEETHLVLRQIFAFHPRFISLGWEFLNMGLGSS